jgi:site-specific DNA-cytosine methylase
MTPNNITHASIIPLIGGMTIAQELENGTPPEYFMTYEGFQANESHLLNYYAQRGMDIPYHYIDRGERPSKRVNVVNTTCPCAGLSQLSHGFGTHNQNNQWMIKTAQYVLGELKPDVFWGENAPGFAGKIGKDIREQVRKIGLDNGYSMSIYRTKSLLHGTAQTRERSFYFFWKGDKTPLLNYYNTPWEKIEDVIRNAKSNTMQDVINSKIPSKDDPYYRFILEEMYGGISHYDFSHSKMEFLKVRSNDVFSFIEQQGYDYKQVGKWLEENGYENEAEKCKYKYDKLASGGNIMRRGTIVPKDFIGAFVGHYPSMLTHPDQDRYITYREALSIMGMPEDFELLNPKKSANHICQNVPVKTARDMAREVNEVLLGNRPYVKSNYTYQQNVNRRYEIWEEKEPTTIVDFMQ